MLNPPDSRFLNSRSLSVSDIDTDTRFSFLFPSSMGTARHKSLIYESVMPWNDSKCNNSYVSLSNTGSRYRVCARWPRRSAGPSRSPYAELRQSLFHL